MKKRIMLFLIIVFAMTTTACSSQTPSEEELREQIIAELELKEQIKAEMEAENATITESTTTTESTTSDSDDSLETSDVNNEKPVPDEEIAVILANRINVRSDSSTDSDVLGIVEEKEIYEITGTSMESSGRLWYKIMTKDETEGYIASWYCLTKAEIDGQTGKWHMMNAFDGIIDGYPNGLFATEEEITDTMNGIEVMNFMGGKVLYNDDISYQFYGTDMSTERPIASINYHGNDEVYGVYIGDTFDKVTSIIGYGDYEWYNESEESELYNVGALITHFYTGDYTVTLVYQDGNTLSWIGIF